jgi:ABC-type Fe3+/spermidine/putrescine transport system ATPase subunit
MKSTENMRASEALPGAPAGCEPRETAPLLELRALSKNFGARSVLRDISLALAAGEFLTILGESGSGKTTLLRLIAGFEQLSSGEIWMAGARLDSLPPYRRRVNTVFQSYALFPHLSVLENVAYGLRIRRVAKSEVEQRVGEVLAMVKMQEYLRSSPSKLSGGQQQRVALARALVNRPQVLLLDEPLSALDANLRRQMQLELKSLQRNVGITFVFVTHDQEEAMALSDRVVLLNQGRIEQVASPREIYNCPATAYAALFIGQSNLLRAVVSEGRASSGKLSWPAPGPDGPASFSLRPECIRVASSGSLPGDSATVRFRARVLDHTFGGATNLVQIQCEDGCVLRASVPGNRVSEGIGEFEFAVADVIRVLDSGPR